MRALIIEDSPEIADAISLCLQLRWPEAVISTFQQGQKGLDAVKSENMDIVILDLNLPDMDGLQVLKKLRNFSNVPVIIVTVRAKEDDQAAGLELGADDYIVKPFRPRDLIARVNALIRRAEVYKTISQKQPTVIRGKVSLDLTNSVVAIGEQKTALTPTEFRLLYILMENADQTVSNEHLLQEIWGRDDSDTEPLRTYVRRLRDKLQDNPPRMLLTDHGTGYRFVTHK
jgi:two-component system, OmpR family, KDP operon response regulator KdpE